MKKWFLLLAMLWQTSFAQQAAIDPNNLYPQVKFETSMGDIIVELDRIRAPLTVDNFLQYVVSGEYDNTVFHRVVTDYVVQGGGYNTELEAKDIKSAVVNESGNGLKNELGTIAMARENKPHSANRQFFFNAADNSNLDPGRSWGYTVFGAIIEGEAVMEAMAKVKTDFNGSLGWEDVPIEPIVLKKATLLPAQ
ncbi:peptidylprolyl isomerase [Thalassotalea marina]|uniref:Peptidyl-prolyl cis-trans isomerase n=1 Tax=Thalassotalea marina TaxID=1673741 RepID=A0A919BE71_9GAMM|nr:peptidyl-prolyl cis-trans isomerase [Thalassotalea marina]